MGRWLALACANAGEKNLKTPTHGTDETDKTHAGAVLSVSSVRQTSVSEKFSDPAEVGQGGSEGFRGIADGAFAENFAEPPPASPPAPAPATRSPVVSVALSDAVAEPRLDWWNAPVEGWREGRLTIRSLLTGKETVIWLPGKRGRA